MGAKEEEEFILDLIMIRSDFKCKKTNVSSPGGVTRGRQDLRVTKETAAGQVTWVRHKQPRIYSASASVCPSVQPQ